MVQDAQAFGDSTTSVSIDRSVARTRVEELRVLEEDGNRLGLLPKRMAYPATDLNLADVRARLVLTSLMEGAPSRARGELAAVTPLHPQPGGRLGGSGCGRGGIDETRWGAVWRRLEGTPGCGSRQACAPCRVAGVAPRVSRDAPGHVGVVAARA